MLRRVQKIVIDNPEPEEPDGFQTRIDHSAVPLNSPEQPNEGVESLKIEDFPFGTHDVPIVIIGKDDYNLNREAFSVLKETGSKLLFSCTYFCK